MYLLYSGYATGLRFGERARNCLRAVHSGTCFVRCPKLKENNDINGYTKTPGAERGLRAQVENWKKSLRLCLY